MSAATAIWIAVGGITLTAILTRMSFVALGERLRLPPLAEQALRHAPAAALGAILAPSLLIVDGDLALTPANHRLLAAVVAALVMWRTRSILWTIVAGLAAFSALRIWL
jgi:branched chain amino acid efflux pump